MQLPSVRRLASWTLAALLWAGRAAGAETAHDAHGDAADGHHAPTLHEVNWVHGVLGEREGVEPSLLWRPPGTPVPVLALAFNTALLFFLLYRIGGPKVSAALSRRKGSIMQGMDEAARMRRDAKKRLSEHKEKLASVDDEVDQVKSQMRQLGEAERGRALAEAKERRARMERDARILVDQELKVAHDLLLRETIKQAMSSAREAIVEQLDPADHERIAEQYLTSVREATDALRGKA
jgi:F-type H+-transporting ATPase subunit b